MLKSMRQELDALQARRNIAGNKLRDALSKAIERDETSTTVQILAEQLAHHADAIRDALAPFDSGVRQANG
jgi:seryl-tRNA synthetase